MVQGVTVVLTAQFYSGRLRGCCSFQENDGRFVLVISFDKCWLTVDSERFRGNMVFEHSTLAPNLPDQIVDLPAASDLEELPKIVFECL